MRKIFLKSCYIFIAAFFSIAISSHAEMSGDQFTMTSSESGSSAALMYSENYDLLGSIGPSTPVGFSENNNFNLESGFMYGTIFSMSLDNAITAVIFELQEEILNNPEAGLSRKGKKKRERALQLLEDALEALKPYDDEEENEDEENDEGEDDDQDDEEENDEALAKAMNKTKSAVKKMMDSGTDTMEYQEMLAQASEFAVEVEINGLALSLGNDDPDIIEARSLLEEGSGELLEADYSEAIESFVHAYEALLVS